MRTEKMLEQKPPPVYLLLVMVSKKYIVALDMGTTSTKGLLYETGNAGGRGKILGSASSPHTCLFPSSGSSVQDPDEILEAAVSVLSSLVSRYRPDPASVEALVFCGVLHSIVPVDGSGGLLDRAMIWSDRRSEEQTARLALMLDREEARNRTGCALNPLYFLPRLLWYREKRPDIYKKARLFISIKEYVLNRLFSTRLVDRSTASGTGVWNLHTLDWDEDLLKTVGLRKNNFSEVVETTCEVGGLRREYADKTGLIAGTPGIAGGADGPLAHLGSAGLDPGKMSLTVGTSGALRKLIPAASVQPDTEAWCYYMAEGKWLGGGVAHDAGNVMQWLADAVLRDEGETIFDRIASTRSIPPGAEGLVFFPFMSGERAPHNNPSAQTALAGLSLSHGRSHIVKALMEGIAYRLHTIYMMLEPDARSECVVTGGILKSPAWLQLLADFFGQHLLIPEVNEPAAWGAVLIGLLALGIAGSMEDLEPYVRISSRVEPDLAVHGVYEKVRLRYDSYYTRLFER